MPVARLLAVVLIALSLPLSAQTQKTDSSFPSEDASASTPAAGQFFKIFPDLPPELNYLQPQGDRPTPHSFNQHDLQALKPMTMNQPFLRFLPDGTVTTDSLCYNIRSYVVARDDKDSDSTHPVRVSTCIPAERYGVKKAVAGGDAPR